MIPEPKEEIKLLRYFKTLKDVFNASDQELISAGASVEFRARIRRLLNRK